MIEDKPGETSSLIWSYIDENNIANLNNVNNRLINLFPNKILPNGLYKFILFENDSYKILNQIEYEINNPEPEPEPEQEPEQIIVNKEAVNKLNNDNNGISAMTTADTSITNISSEATQLIVAKKGDNILPLPLTPLTMQLLINQNENTDDEDNE